MVHHGSQTQEKQGASLTAYLALDSLPSKACICHLLAVWPWTSWLTLMFSVPQFLYLQNMNIVLLNSGSLIMLVNNVN
jgi:hypothetical protein